MESPPCLVRTTSRTRPRREVLPRETVGINDGRVFLRRPAAGGRQIEALLGNWWLWAVEIGGVLASRDPVTEVEWREAGAGRCLITSSGHDGNDTTRGF